MTIHTSPIRPYIHLVAAMLLSGCLQAATASSDPSEGSLEGITTAPRVVPGWGYLYRNGTASNFRLGGLGSGTMCDDGSSATSCLVDSVDFRLSGFSSQEAAELVERFRIADSNLANVSVIVAGQWNVVTVRDHRAGRTGSYRRVDFQILDAYKASTTAPHSTTFFKLSGTTVQRAQIIPTSHTLPFTAVVSFSEPVLANASGVVPDAFVTGTMDASAPPVQITADRYFRPL